MNTGLVRQAAELPGRAEVDKQLGELAISGDTTTLCEIALQASAYQEYEKRQQAKSRADEFGRIKVLAEAHIGLIDIRENPRPRTYEPMNVGDIEIAHHTRREWRLLGSGLQRGALEEAIKFAVEDDFRSLTTNFVYRDLMSRGVAWVPAPVLREQYLKLNGGKVHRGRGHKMDVAIADIADRSGVPRRLVQRYLGPSCRRVPHVDAIRIALAMGLDPGKLGTGVPQSLRRKRSTQPQRKLHRSRKLPGGRLDEAYSLVRRALQELDHVAGSNGKYGTDAAWDHLYQAEDIIGKALKRAS